MMRPLVLKLLRDVRVSLLVVVLLLLGFQCLWAKVTARIVGELLPLLIGMAAAQRIPAVEVWKTIFEGPGQIMRTLMGGENIQLDNAMDFLSIGYIHPLMQTVFCIWAVGRAAGALAGELDRGTMELLLAQPIPRRSVVLAHLCVDALTIPVLCLALWAGTWLGTTLVWPIEVPTNQPLPFRVEVDPATLEVHPAVFGPALWNVGALLFAVSGYTMWLSACGRLRWRVLGTAVIITLVQFLVNVIGQLWDAMAWLRPFTVFFYYQPQQIALSGRWSVDLGTVWNGGAPLVAVNVLAVLFGVGAVGYVLALWTFCRRDLPAPL
jgi:ABC-2 type transport system permease protein